MTIFDGLQLFITPLVLVILSPCALGQNTGLCTGTGTNYNAPSSGNCLDSWSGVGGSFVYPNDFDVLNQVEIYTCPLSKKRIIISNGIPDHTVEKRKNALPCEFNWAVSVPLNPTESSVPTEIPAKGIIAMATNGVPAYGALEADDANAVEPDGLIQDAQFWYGHSTASGIWHVHNPYMGAENADSTTLLGWALDGYAIYGPFDSGSDDLNELDNCNGREVNGTYQYHVRKREDVNENLDYCKGNNNPETNWNYILGCYHGTTDLTEVRDSTSFTIPSDCVTEGAPTKAPVAAPSAPSVSDQCVDSPLRIKIPVDDQMVARSCEWVARKKTDERCAISGVIDTCPSACGTCGTCSDSPLRIKFLMEGEPKKIARSCEWVARRLTDERCGIDGMADTCRSTCGSC